MHPTMKALAPVSTVGWFVVVAALLVIGPVMAEDAFHSSWMKHRSVQPTGLSLELKLPKATFYQGEVMPAELIFRNVSTNQYFLWTGTYDRSGRVPDISLIAQDKNGVAVLDPLKWYFANGCFMGGGLGGHGSLGEWSITLAANQWLRFDHPGTYRLYAQSNRPQPGRMDYTRTTTTNLNLVSDIITIHITALPAEQEAQVIANAQAAINKGAPAAKTAVEQLRYLQTPAARKVLLSLLAGEQSFDASMGLAGAPNLAAEAEAVLAAARQPDVAASHNAAWLYAKLKTADLKLPTALEQRSKAIQEADRAAHAEFVTAVRATLDQKKGTALLTTVLTLLDYAPQDQQLRTLLVEHRQELSAQQVREIVSRWERLGGNDLIPIIQMAAKPPMANPAALGLLAKIAPAEARPLIVEDLGRDKPIYLDPGAGRYAIGPYAALPDRELPELDPILRRKLRAKECDLFTVMPMVARYATTNLLIDVVEVYQRAEGGWACDIQNAALRYWIRCQPEEGVQALARAVKARKATGCYHNTLSEVLQESWTTEALPLLVASMKDEDPEVADSAVKVLEQRGPPTIISEIIAAIGRMFHLPETSESPQKWRAEWLASSVASSKNLMLSREQLAQLAEVVSPSRTADAIRKQAAQLR